MNLAITEAQENKANLEAQIRETNSSIRQFGNVIQTVSREAGNSRRDLDDMVGQGSEGIEDMRRKLRDLEMSSLRSQQWVVDRAEEEEQVAVLTESISRLRYQIEVEIEDAEAKAAAEATKESPKDIYTHWLGTGEPLVDAAAMLVDELEAQSQMHKLGILKNSLEGNSGPTDPATDNQGSDTLQAKGEALKTQ